MTGDADHADSDAQNVFGRLLDALARGLEDQKKAHPPDRRGYNSTWEAVNHHDYIALYQGDEVMAKIRPEDADEIVGQLAMALEKRRAGNAK
jgi:hypothetical protein